MNAIKIILTAGILIIAIAILIIMLSLQLRFNATSSMPRGIYREVNTPLIVGSIVEVCLPTDMAQFGKSRGYIHAGNCPGNAEPLLKEVVALGGDNLQVNDQGVFINGKLLPHSSVLHLDELHRPLISHVINTRFVLGVDEVWFYGVSDPKSWDSRYYGAVKRENIRHILKPIWTW